MKKNTQNLKKAEENTMGVQTDVKTDAETHKTVKKIQHFLQNVK